MKQIILTIALLSGLAVLSAFTSQPAFESNSPEKHSLQQQQTVSAYRMAGGNWQRGTVSYKRTQQGYKPVSYDFSGYRGGSRGGFFPDARFTPLNPNNKLAIQNNWTHMVGSNAGTLYMTLN